MTNIAIDEQKQRYSTVAILLHWAIAGFVAANLVIGSFMESLPGALRISVVRVHESFGLTIFVLAIIRLAWRLGHTPPPFPAATPVWERWLAHLAQFFFYVLMIGMPIIGWMLISSRLLRPMIIYGVLTLPPFTPFSRLANGPSKTALHDQLVSLHATGAWIFVGLLCLHVAAAVKHQFWDRQGQFARMGIGR
jgi:cytochrome b561